MHFHSAPADLSVIFSPVSGTNSGTNSQTEQGEGLGEAFARLLTEAEGTPPNAQTSQEQGGEALFGQSVLLDHIDLAKLIDDVPEMDVPKIDLAEIDVSGQDVPQIDLSGQGLASLATSPQILNAQTPPDLALNVALSRQETSNLVPFIPKGSEQKTDLGNGQMAREILGQIDGLSLDAVAAQKSPISDAPTSGSNLKSLAQQKVSINGQNISQESISPELISPETIRQEEVKSQTQQPPLKHSQAEEAKPQEALLTQILPEDAPLGQKERPVDLGLIQAKSGILTPQQQEPPTAQTTLARTGLSQEGHDQIQALSMTLFKRLSQGQTRFHIELFPAHQGRVDVSIGFERDGRLNLSLGFDKALSAEQFLKGEGALRQELAVLGFDMKDAHVAFRITDEEKVPLSEKMSEAPLKNGDLRNTDPNRLESKNDAAIAQDKGQGGFGSEGSGQKHQDHHHARAQIMREDHLIEPDLLEEVQGDHRDVLAQNMAYQGAHQDEEAHWQRLESHLSARGLIEASQRFHLNIKA